MRPVELQEFQVKAAPAGLPWRSESRQRPEREYRQHQREGKKVVLVSRTIGAKVRSDSAANSVRKKGGVQDGIATVGRD